MMLADLFVKLLFIVVPVAVTISIAVFALHMSKGALDD